MKTLEEKKREKEDTEALVKKVADYMNFMEPAEEELNEDGLELVTAAGPVISYAQFLRKLNKK